MNDYIKIDWADVRVGDVLMHENGERLTVYSVAFFVTCSGIAMTSTGWGEAGWTPHRKVEPPPTAPGHYLDRYGEHWELGSQGGDRPWLFDGERYRDKDAAKCAPFTRLVPMPTEEQIREALQTANAIEVMGHVNYSTLATAVMELLAGESDE